MKKRPTLLLVISFALLYCSNAAALEQDNQAQTKLDQTYVFFPFMHAEIRPDAHHDPDLEEFEVEYGSDFFYLLNYKKVRALGEVVVSNEELELERLQFGYDITPDSTLWLGRYHAPLGFWNSNYHHGLHLQTSVHRPGIIEFEENGGVLANHLTGALLEGLHYTQNGVVNYSVAVGFSPVLEHTLEPYTPGESDNKLQSIIKVGYQPDETSPSETGFVLSKSTIKAEHSLQLNQVHQQFLGIYTHQSWEKYRITASAYLVDNTIEYHSTKDTDSSFAAGYLHAEYDIASKWIIYSRLERAIGGKHDPYLELFDHSETQRNLGGVRYDITRRQAIRSEISKRIDDHDSHTHISIQWSAVFP